MIWFFFNVNFFSLKGEQCHSGVRVNQRIQIDFSNQWKLFQGKMVWGIDNFFTLAIITLMKMKIRWPVMSVGKAINDIWRIRTNATLEPDQYALSCKQVLWALNRQDKCLSEYRFRVVCISRAFFICKTLAGGEVKNRISPVPSEFQFRLPQAPEFYLEYYSLNKVKE